MQIVSVEELQEEVEKWKSKYQSQVGKMGAYKTKVQKEVREREEKLQWTEKRIDEKIKFLENNNYEDLYDEKRKVLELKRNVEQNDDFNREQLKNDFEVIKNQIIDELSQELVRWTEEHDIDNERSQGYVIGINKAKKIIKEKMIFKLSTQSVRLTRLLENLKESGE